MTDERPETSPTAIGRYHIVRTLGEGGMGSVFLASDPAIDRLIALKLMRSGFNTGSFRERFEREARAIGRLHHPNIVTIFEFGEHQGEPFIAMEYVEGHTLSSLVGREDVGLSQQLALMDGLCAGLHYAHRAGVIHRDVKPVNVMVDDEGIVKILDFGIARAAALSLTQAGTQPGTVLGTLNYMSPEQLSGKSVDQRTDIFAVGAVFYELLAGRQAFPGNLDTGILQLILLTGPTPLADLRPDLDPAVVAIVNRCLERDVDRRYPDLGAMRKDLAAVSRTESGPRSAGATVILAPGRSPSGITPQDVRTPGPDTRAATERTRRAQFDAQILEAQTALDREEYTRATEVCQQVLGVEPTHPGALALQAQLNTVLKARAWLADGQTELNRGAVTAAAALVDRALAVRPAMPEGLKLRAAIEESRQRAQQTAASAPTMLIAPGTAPTQAADAGATVIMRPTTAAPPTATPPPSGTAASGPVALPPAPIEAKRSKSWIGIAAGVVAVAGIGAFFALRGGQAAPPATTADTSAPPVTAPAPTASAEPAPAPAAAAVTPPATPPSSATTEPAATAPVAKTPDKAPTNAARPAPPPVTVAPAAAPPSTPPPPVDAKPTPPSSGAGDGGGAGADPASGGATSTAPGGRALRGRQDAVGSTNVMATPVAERNCKNGNAHACTEAGLGYRNGRGVVASETTAVTYYQKGCDGGDPFGCVDLGQMYFQGSGVPHDDTKALALYQKGCDANVPAGCFYLGGIYQLGRFVPRSEARAYDYFVKACDGNNFVGCNDAALIMEQGRGVAGDDAKLFALLKKSCDGNYLVGCRNLGVLYQEGRGVVRNDTEAVALFGRGCDGRLAMACTNLGQMFNTGRGVPKSDAEAKTLFSKACDLGDANGCRLKGGG